MRTIEIEMPIKEYSDPIIDLFFKFAKERNIDPVDTPVRRYFAKPGSLKCKLCLSLGIRCQHYTDEVVSLIKDMDFFNEDFSIEVI